jgi:hypothetical protein
MSLFYDFQKWTILSLTLVAISLTVGFLMQYAHGILINGSYYDTDAYIERLKMIKQYCLDHTDRILAGGNPVQDLINAGMIPKEPLQDITCQNVDSKIFWAEAGKGENLKDALGID